MKKIKLISAIVFTLLGVSISFYSSAQHWGEIGNKWVYQRVSQNELSLVKYEIVKDTIIDNTKSKIFKASLLTYFGVDTMVFHSESYLYDLYFSSKGDSIFWYNKGAFEFLYDFSPSPDETWVTFRDLDAKCNNPNPIKSIRKVKSISEKKIDGKNIEVIELMPGDNWNMGTKIYKNIGPQSGLFPQLLIDCNGKNIGSTIGMTSSLFCFDSKQTGSIQFFDLDNPNSYIVKGYTGCEKTFATKIINDVRNDISVYPNPLLNDELFLKNPDGLKIKYIRVFDITGKLKEQYSDPGERIKISKHSFTNGIYFMQFIDEENLILDTKKIIINHE